MSDAPKVPAVRLAADLNNVPVQIVDGVQTFGMIGGTINITLVTNRIGVRENGDAFDEFIVAARLRFDPVVGKMIRDAIDSQLTLLSAPTQKAN